MTVAKRNKGRSESRRQVVGNSNYTNPALYPGSSPDEIRDMFVRWGIIGVLSRFGRAE